MRYSVVSSSEISNELRLDAKFFVGEKHEAIERLEGADWPLVRLGELVGDASVWVPPRFTLVPAADIQFGKPYLAPWDTLRYMPRSNVILSRVIKEFSHAEVQAGWLLITSSGRNLSPCVYVDDFLSTFAVSSDMIRVSAQATDDLFYVMAFLHTTPGRQQLSGDKWGSVIDHIQPKNVRNVLVPMLSADIRKKVSRAFRQAAALREQARRTISNAESRFLDLTGLRQAIQSLPSDVYSRRFTTQASRLRDRLDAEPYAPLYEAYRQVVLASASSAHLREVADTHRPPGRYKTIYVQDPLHGIPLLSGRQISQFRPVGLKFISPMSFRNPDAYRLTAGTLVLAADGRAEENLADCAVIMSDRQGWAASGHVVRLVPREGVNLGLLYLACTCSVVQAQMKALATGSVVDALSEADIREVLIPYPSHDEKALKLGNDVIQAWQDFAVATQIEDQAIALLESELFQASLPLPVCTATPAASADAPLEA